MGVLGQIIEQKQRELDALISRKLPPPPERRRLALDRASNAGRVSLISEIKLRSPSAGKLSTVLSVAERAAAYERAGASMLSVLCDSKFFDGDFEHLQQALLPLRTGSTACRRSATSPSGSPSSPEGTGYHDLRPGIRPF